MMPEKDPERENIYRTDIQDDDINGLLATLAGVLCF